MFRSDYATNEYWNIMIKGWRRVNWDFVEVNMLGQKIWVRIGRNLLHIRIPKRVKFVDGKAHTCRNQKGTVLLSWQAENRLDINKYITTNFKSKLRLEKCLWQCWFILWSYILLDKRWKKYFMKGLHHGSAF